MVLEFIQYHYFSLLGKSVLKALRQEAKPESDNYMNPRYFIPFQKKNIENIKRMIPNPLTV